MSITIIIPEWACSNDQFNILSYVSMHIAQVQTLSIYFFIVNWDKIVLGLVFKNNRTDVLFQ